MSHPDGDPGALTTRLQGLVRTEVKRTYLRESMSSVLH